MEMHGQVGGIGGTRKKLEDKRASGFAIQGFENDTIGHQGSIKSQGDQNYRRCKAQSKQSLGQ